MISAERIIGLVEGEGCFSISIMKYIDRKPRPTGRKNNRKNQTLPFRVVPNFRITLVEKDRRLLDEVKETLGFGSIYIQKRKDSNCESAAHYYTKSLEENLKIKDYFQKLTFYTTKEQDFQNWCKCLEIVKKGQHLTKEGLLEICKLRDQMNTKKNKSVRNFEAIKRVLEENPGHIEAHKNQILHNQNLLPTGWFDKKQGNSKTTLKELDNANSPSDAK